MKNGLVIKYWIIVNKEKVVFMNGLISMCRKNSREWRVKFKPNLVSFLEPSFHPTHFANLCFIITLTHQTLNNIYNWLQF